LTKSVGRGRFITFEGPEGSGKSLQAQRLVERLRGTGASVVVTREPGGTPLGDELRTLALLRQELDVTDRSRVLLMCAARAQHVDRLIGPALERGEIVVCDRFGDSTLAYQGCAEGLPLGPLAEVNRFATGGLVPDLTILLDISVVEGLARKRRQVEAGAQEWNRFEAESLAFHERVRAGYHALASADAARWCTFDARLSPDALADAIWARVMLLVNQGSPPGG
jgi:dTMP kinase